MVLSCFNLLVAIRGTDARDETDSPLIPPESRSAVGNPEEEQGTAVHVHV